jgi:uncharacterized membrane protein
MFVLKLFAVLGSGLVAGVFFAFSTFVMKALSRLKPDLAIAAMQSINITAINPLFMLALFGTSGICIFLAISALSHWDRANAAYLFCGSLIYLIGTVGVTIAFNVPMNEALAKVDPSSPEGTDLWASYLINWTNWNHVRTVAGLLATAAFSIALRLV